MPLREKNKEFQSTVNRRTANRSKGDIVKKIENVLGFLYGAIQANKFEHIQGLGLGRFLHKAGGVSFLMEGDRALNRNMVRTK